MNTGTKDFLKGISANAIGTLLAAGVLTLLAFLAGKIHFVLNYWKELSLALVAIFVVVTFILWFKKLLFIEKELEALKLSSKDTKQQNYSNDIASLKGELAKKADKSSVPNNTAIKDLRRSVKELNVFMHAQKGQMGELIGLIELLKEDIDEDSWRIEGVLEDLEKAIDGMNLKSDFITDIEEQVCRLESKPKYNFLVNKIRKHYQN